MSTLPWCMNLKFQAPMQYCSLQHQILVLPSDTSTPEHRFHFDPATSFFLELLVIALCYSPVAYWTPSDLRDSFSSVISFCLFILFMGFSRWDSWSGLPFPPPVDHVLSKLFSMTCPSWVALHGMTHRLWSVKWDQLCIYIYPLFFCLDSFPIAEYWVEFPVLYSWFLLVVYFYIAVCIP